jgi:hypothetical protein
MRPQLRLFLSLLLVLLAYTLLERELRAQLDQVPVLFDLAGITLTLASFPWSLAALGFFRAAGSPLMHAARDVLYLLIFTGGTALNIVLLTTGLSWIMRRLRRG